MEISSEIVCCGGRQLVVTHRSSVLGCDMTFGLFLPPQISNAEKGRVGVAPVPILLYLSGLTCTWENVVTKGFAQMACAEHGIAFLSPDTSPRGDGVADSPDYDLGQGAGFYLDATQGAGDGEDGLDWAKNFRMRSYIEQELPSVIGASDFALDMDRIGICGHSMGGHGALTIALRSPQRYRSLSAFAPIVAPSRVPWGEKVFSAYLGSQNREAWLDYDACALLEKTSWASPILIDQGDSDSFLDEQLKPHLFAEIAARKAIALELRMQRGYDHSYYFIMSFMAEHVAFHARQLRD